MAGFHGNVATAVEKNDADGCKVCWVGFGWSVSRVLWHPTRLRRRREILVWRED